MPTVDWNRQIWGEQHSWAEDGDEWSGMAAFCRQPYPEWKATLVERFLTPYAGGARILEIGPGHGRWAELLAERATRLTLVDINQSCLDFCRERFGTNPHVAYHLTDGWKLDFLEPGSVDFIWSFDSFVHMDAPVVEGYISEFGRVLAPGGTVVIHHAAKPPWVLALRPVTGRLGKPGRVLQRFLVQHRLRGDGFRSDVSAAMVARWAEQAGLRVREQTDSWGDSGQYTVKKYRDCISVLERH
jgi:ubiquinone/menaquinone biosynthesis C-methylase UbiE